MVTAYGLNFGYDKKPVLKDVAISVNRGELVCLLGANGAGKSTLFRCLLSLITDYEGNVMIDGRDARRLLAAERSQLIAYIPQAHQPVFDYTVREVILMGITGQRGLFSIPESGDESVVDEVLEEVGITDLAERSYARLSGGERQLTLVARALAQRARILVLDEPTANLDYGNQVRVMEHLASLAKSGYGILISTHNPEHAFLWATRVALMENGAISADGDPADVLTEERLERVYGVAVSVVKLDGADGQRVCLPSVQRREVCNR